MLVSNYREANLHIYQDFNLPTLLECAFPALARMISAIFPAMPASLDGLPCLQSLTRTSRSNSTEIDSLFSKTEKLLGVWNSGDFSRKPLFEVGMSLSWRLVLVIWL